MKELSIEEKAKRFDRAIEIARKISNGECVPALPNWTVYEVMFPELKEGEDERIRNFLISKMREVGNVWKEYSAKDIIAFLEKQGEQKPAKNIIETWKDMRLEAYQQASGNRHEPNYSDDNTKMFSLNDIDEIIEKMSEQKPADKVEPKFKVGDWIVNKGHSYLIGYIDYEQGRYLFEIGGYTHEQLNWEYIENADNKYHLWTIQDAKDGDVLACNINKAEIGGDIEKLPNITPTICLYQNVVKDNDYIHTYCSLYNRSSLLLSNSIYYNTFVYNIHPATKEQRDLLFQKMKEAGYEWLDKDRKLIKIVK